MEAKFLASNVPAAGRRVVSTGGYESTARGNQRVAVYSSDEAKPDRQSASFNARLTLAASRGDGPCNIGIRIRTGTE